MNLGERILSRLCSIRGISVTELLVVLAVVAVLSAVAIPQGMAWKRNQVYRQATREIMLALREARSKALCANREHRVELKPVEGMYRITRGNRSNDSTTWNEVVRGWTPLPREIRISASVSSIQMNTNGTATASHVFIEDSFAKIKYKVIVASSGRIRLDKAKTS